MKFYRHPFYVTLLCFLSAVLLPAQLIPAPQSYTSTLRSSVNNIYCAGDRYGAAYHIQDLQKQKLYLPGIPLEAASGISKELRATTLDKTLQVLYDSAEKFPENKQLIEKTVIRWNFCSLIDNGTIYDHLTLNGKTVRYPSSVANKHHWSGFYAFGLMPDADRHQRSFDFTTPYTNTAIRSLADRNLQQRYINHCLPHPDDEHLYRSYGRNFISRIIPASKSQSPLVEQEWHLECAKEPEEIPETKPKKEQVEPLPLTQAPATNNELQQVPLAVINNLEAIFATDITPNDPTHLGNPSNEDQTPDLSAAIHLPVENLSNHKAKNKVVDSVVVPIPFNEYEIALAKATEPYTDVTPITVTGPRKGNDIVTPTTGRSKGLSGSISLNNSAFNAKNTSLNFAVSYKPIKDSYWFIRSGFNLTSESKPLTYTWGVGYDDWHAATWAVQLNNWGPLKPGDGLDIKNAVAEISYKFKKNWLVKRNLASALSLSKPLSSKPAINWGWSWNPRSHWFIRSTITKPFDDKRLDWSYGFGYTGYNNNSLSFEYNNWGPNNFPDLNFKRNALLSLIYRWGF